MKNLKLKTVHRLLLKGIIDAAGQKGGTLSEIQKYLKILEKLSFTEEETKLLKIRVENDKVLWNVLDDDKNEIDLEKDFEFSDEQIEIIKNAIKKKDEAKEFTFSDVTPISDIAGQVGYELK